MAELTDEQVERALARIAASDREEDAARTVASVLETLADDLQRWRGQDRRNMAAALARFRPDVTVPAPVEHFSGDDALFREFVDDVERQAHEFIAKLTGTEEETAG